MAPKRRERIAFVVCRQGTSVRSLGRRIFQMIPDLGAERIGQGECWWTAVSFCLGGWERPFFFLISVPA